MITVITVTGRELFLDRQVMALKNQTHKDFEWVLVDDIYHRREDKVKELVGDSFQFTHIPPNNLVDYFAVGAAHNDGFVHARGELVYFMIDYVLPNPITLERHWELFQTYPKNMISGRCMEVDFTPADMDNINGVVSGSDYRLNLFTNIHRLSKMNEWLYAADRRGVQNWWGGRNDSAPLEAILACNGMDEQLDGGYGYHDDDLAQRMMTYGLGYLYDMKSVCLQFAHEKSGKKQLRTWNEQQYFKDKIIPGKIKDGIYRANPNRDLIKEREECLKQSV